MVWWTLQGSFWKVGFSFLRLIRQFCNVKILDIIDVTNPGNCPRVTVELFICRSSVSTSNLHRLVIPRTASCPKSAGFLGLEVNRNHGLEVRKTRRENIHISIGKYVLHQDPYMFLLWYLNPVIWNDSPYHHCIWCVSVDIKIFTTSLNLWCLQISTDSKGFKSFQAPEIAELDWGWGVVFNLWYGGCVAKIWGTQQFLHVNFPVVIFVCR